MATSRTDRRRAAPARAPDGPHPAARARLPDRVAARRRASRSTACASSSASRPSGSGSRTTAPSSATRRSGRSSPARWCSASSSRSSPWRSAVCSRCSCSGSGAFARIVLQVSLLLAWAMPVVAAMTVWIWIVDWRRGLLNWLLVRVGVDGADQHNWLAEPLSFFVVAGVIVVWMSVPFVALSIYAGLTQVSTEVLEAAQLDGASWWQRLRYVIAPADRARDLDRPSAAADLGPARLHADQDAAGRRRRSPTRPTCSARSSTSSARARATSGCRAPSAS